MQFHWFYLIVAAAWATVLVFYVAYKHQTDSYFDVENEGFAIVFMGSSCWPLILGGILCAAVAYGLWRAVNNIVLGFRHAAGKLKRGYASAMRVNATANKINTLRQNMHWNQNLGPDEYEVQRLTGQELDALLTQETMKKNGWE